MSLKKMDLCAVGGVFKEVAPGCSVLPLPEVSSVLVDTPFAGHVLLGDNGLVTGRIQDAHGCAEIVGMLTGDELSFRKHYPDGNTVFYRLRRREENGEFRGGYGFEEAFADSSEREVRLLLGDPIPA